MQPAPSDAADMPGRLDRNRAVVGEFYQRLAARDLAGLLLLLDDDARWTVAGDPATFWPAGTQSKPERAKTLGAFLDLLADLSIEVRSLTAERDRVAVALTAHGTSRGGVHYDNEFLVLLRLRGGRIIDIYEHCDQQAALAFARAVGGEALSLPTQGSRE